VHFEGETFVLDHEYQWDGYRFEVFGVVYDINIPGLRATSTSLCPPGPITWQFRDEQTGEVTLQLELRRQRAYYGDDPPIVAELHWWPGLPEAKPFLQIVHDRYTTTDRKAAEKGLALLRQLPPNHRGGPPGPRKFPTAESFHHAIHEKLYERCYRNNWQLANYPETRWTEWLGCAYGTYKAARDTYGLAATGISAGYARYVEHQRNRETK
jgi:hypothetical protein